MFYCCCGEDIFVAEKTATKARLVLGGRIYGSYHPGLAESIEHKQYTIALFVSSIEDDLWRPKHREVEVLCKPSRGHSLNTNARYKRRLPREAVRSFANQLRRVRIKFNMAADSNTREVSLLVRSVSFFVLLLHIATQVQNIVENHCL